MNLTLTPKLKKNFLRILPFGIIFFVTGMVFLFVEGAATGFRNLNPDTAVTVTLPVFIFASIAVFIAGLGLGAVEVFFLEKQFSDHSFIKKLLLKFAIYIFIIFLIFLTTFPIAASLETGIGLFHPEILKRTASFFSSITFISTAVQIGFSLLLCLLYTTISENLGHYVIYNFFTGKYHRPVDEERIFMFLDMKSSTAIAEKIGHNQYFKLLKAFYMTMSNAIIQHEGEIYQYVGDEVVISWEVEPGVRNSNCIRCFYAIKEKFNNKKEEFIKEFGVFPDFRAAVHIGEVTTGEIGGLKKEIVFTGDVLNTTARMQELCKEYESDFLISGQLKEMMEDNADFSMIKKGEKALRGKSTTIKYYEIQKSSFSFSE